MAISRINPTKVVRVISVEDEAIDKEKSPKIHSDELGKEQLKYSETLDESDLVLKEGVKPTYFHLKNLDSDEQAELFSDHIEFDAKEKRQRYNRMPVLFSKLFKTCCVKVEEDGKPIPKEEVPYGIKQEMGSTVLLRSQMGDKDKKKSKRSSTSK